MFEICTFYKAKNSTQKDTAIAATAAAAASASDVLKRIREASSSGSAADSKCIDELKSENAKLRSLLLQGEII